MRERERVRERGWAESSAEDSGNAQRTLSAGARLAGEQRRSREARGDSGDCRCESWRESQLWAVASSCQHSSWPLARQDFDSFIAEKKPSLKS